MKERSGVHSGREPRNQHFNLNPIQPRMGVNRRELCFNSSFLGECLCITTILLLPFDFGNFGNHGTYGNFGNVRWFSAVEAGTVSRALAVPTRPVPLSRTARRKI